MNQDLNGMKVAILVVDGFEQVEMTEPRKALQQAGAQTMLVSAKAGRVQGFHHDKPGDSFGVELTLEQARPEDFDAVLLPGGVMNADQIRMNQDAQRFVQGMQREGKPLAVICHGAWLLVSAGLVEGRTMTSWPTLQDDLRNAGANWVDREVVRDGNWVSSRKPDDIPAFNREMVQLFASSHATA
ncbi:MAG TPA: type 1 glutamine amidotransferase domain-containing protein [Ramlibacter sp.]|uniref:type 1 glutamine amidotransferase domain-containing protein n=1 Tax=Ramlibacter sp. TaxID=1917967 RepID=UPI002D7E2600|nr:type 1 glutamine amidotransferase domain-containing protein [Ramlibacter sp.]HET8748508.1 type 1 glutamine amidotransferase domain-containing protein [Ramlibacter sp.]